VGGNILILEECAYIPSATFFEVILPILSLATTSLIGITTVSGASDNYINNLIRMGIFEHFEIVLVCKTCRRAGKISECTHESTKRPKWQSQERASMIKTVYGAAKSDVHAREAVGVLVEQDMKCFKKDKVLTMFQAYRHSLPRKANELFVVIDPCGGSMEALTRKSDFALMTFVNINGRIYVIGLEAFWVRRPEDYENRVIQHIRMCRKNPMLRDSLLVCIVEGNLALEASHIRRMLLNAFPRNIQFMGDQGKKDGVLTTETSKHAMALVFDTALNEEKISIIKEFVTTHENSDELLGLAQTQLLDYSRLTTEPKNVFGRVSVRYSGKGSSPGARDDLAIVFQLGLMWSQRYYSSDEHINTNR